MRTVSIWTALALASLGSYVGGPRQLTFEQRVEAQQAIERINYAHQIGTSRPFEEAVSRQVLEERVRKYLRQSAVLDEFWNAPVTAEALEREFIRIVERSRLPERLVEIYDALGRDDFLIQETLVRAALVSRLSDNFFAYDQRIHGATRREAERLREKLANGELDVWAEAEGREELEMVLAEDAHPSDVPSNAANEAPDGMFSGRIRLTAEQFARWRQDQPGRVGEIGQVVEERQAFVIKVILAEESDRLRVATYHVPKISWNEWWPDSPMRSEEDVRPVAVRPIVSPMRSRLTGAGMGKPEAGIQEASGAHATSPLPVCAPQGIWDNRGLNSPPPQAIAANVAVWTGTRMIVWGGFHHDGYSAGGQYDPVLDLWTPMSTANAQDTYTVTAVWAGTRMIVWGGTKEDAVTDSGRMYDPLSDKWTVVSPRNAPGPRAGHSMVWTGSRMIVWGGYLYVEDGGLNIPLNTGAQYDPESDSWTPTSTLNAPSARSGHTAVWTGTRMIVWGGAGALNAGGEYDPESDTWAPTSRLNAPAGRSGHTAVWTGTRMIVWGGAGAGSRYDPESDGWSPMSGVDEPSARTGHTAVWTGSRMIIWGGGDAVGGQYDPVSDSWTPTSTLNAPSARPGHLAVWTGTRMVVWSGMSSTGGQYDPVSDSWLPTSRLNVPAARTGYGVVWTGTRMIVWGRTYLTGAQYDPMLDLWSPMSTVYSPSERYNSTAIWSGTRMVVWGGLRTWDGAPLSTGGQYDPVSDTWTPTSTLNAPLVKGGHTAVWTGTRMIVWGGLGGEGAYDPESDLWTRISMLNAPAARSGHQAVWTGTRMIVWGGAGDSTGGQYDPASNSWTPTSTLNAPSARSRHTAVWTGTRMIVWGGDGRSYDHENTGGQYDPLSDSWTETSTHNAPSGRIGQTAVWTGTRMIVWGGYSGWPVNTGGQYDPVRDSWTATSIVNAPSPRVGHSAVWTGSEMLVWAGAGSGDNVVFNSGGRYLTDASPDSDADGASAACGDCDDSDPTVHPAAAEACDGADNDCDGTADGFVTSCGIGSCAALGECAAGVDSCDPASPSREVCDGLDNDCNGAADDADGDRDSFRVCDDCNDLAATVNPLVVDTCNAVDDNCNGLVDDDPSGLDSDGDGVPNACDSCRFAYNPMQADIDSDGVGNSCDNCISAANPRQEDLDADQRGNACDNCPTEYNFPQDDADMDGVGDVCDNCPGARNGGQEDTDGDRVGDACELDELQAVVDVIPDTLNLGSPRTFISMLLGVPGHSARSIDPTSVRVAIAGKGPVVPSHRGRLVGDRDGDGVEDLMMRLSRAEVAAIATNGDGVAFEVRGRLVGGQPFVGRDFVRVVCVGRDKGGGACAEPVLRRLGRRRPQ